MGGSSQTDAREFQNLRQREAALTEAQAVAHVGSWELDLRTGAGANWSAELYRIFGVDPDSYEPTLDSFFEFVHPDDRVRVAAELERAQESGSDYEVVYRIVRPDGVVRTVMARARVFNDPDGVALRMVGAGLDLTDTLEQQERLASRTALLDLSQELTSAGSFEWEVGGPEVHWSDGMFRIFGLEPGSVTPTFDRYIEFIHPDEREDRRAAIGEVVSAGEACDAEHRIIRADGQVRWVESRIRLIGAQPEDAGRVVGVCQDVTDRRLQMDGMVTEVASARERALHDPLTGLANRSLAFDRLDHAFDLAQRGGSDLAVLFLDLDGFKRINDQFGHAAGDALLASAATRMSECARGSDTVARIGGDEFLIICEGPDGAEQARNLAARVIESFSAPMRVADADRTVSVSIGASVLGGRSVQSPRQLVDEADRAMYQAKAENPGGVFFHSPG